MPVDPAAEIRFWRAAEDLFLVRMYQQAARTTYNPVRALLLGGELGFTKGEVAELVHRLWRKKHIRQALLGGADGYKVTRTGADRAEGLLMDGDSEHESGPTREPVTISIVGPQIGSPIQIGNSNRLTMAVPPDDGWYAAIEAAAQRAAALATELEPESRATVHRYAADTLQAAAGRDPLTVRVWARRLEGFLLGLGSSAAVTIGHELTSLL